MADKHTFTQDGNEALRLAREEADRLGAKFIGPKHLLLGLIRYDGEVGEFLRAVGLDVGEIEQMISSAGSRLASSSASGHAFLIMNSSGDVVAANKPAEDLIRDHQKELLDSIRHNDGNAIAIRIGDKTYITVTGDVPGMGSLAILRDVTESANREREIDNLFYALVHDFRASIAIIKGYAEVMADPVKLPENKQHPWANSIQWIFDKMQDILTDARLLTEWVVSREITVDFAKKIVHTADRLNKMVDDLGLWGVSIAENLKRTPEPCNLRAIVTETVPHFTTIEDFHGVRSKGPVPIRFEPGADDVYVSGDPYYLSGLVGHLISNVIRYAPESKEVEIDLIRDANTARLSVRSQGTSIPEKEMQALFDRFITPYGRRSTSHLPARLHGPWIVKAIAEAHGGTAEARNLPEGGTEFVVTLPAAEDMGEG